ncbi:MerR family transcriptional regulator [Deinococcus multiflagellatus]|uniref:MerR family transcriptional regulator n=1 Tax=Deinococcus multiflagellatus TaxID=1656887 RepID=UPI001CCD71D0|nr:MerR family transcriptional regulator [Deinococcus multiflagellatus]MBZ9712814.1 MerR family transcriptional regulator [Deinococcus multiflagellatus]
MGEVSGLTRISVRTLHHYDEIGLLRPSERSEGNYRLYTPADLARLRAALTYRQLGFPLAEVTRLLDAPPAEQRRALETQLLLLQEGQRRTQATIDAVQAMLNAPGAPMSNEDVKAVFDGFDPEQYEPEVQARWGETDAYRQSKARTGRYTRADWEAIKAEMQGIQGQYVALMDAGAAPHSPQAQAVAAQHHAHIHSRYYDAPPAMMRGLAQMWVQDERFTRTIDQARPGLAAYQSAAVTAWADAQEAQD